MLNTLELKNKYLSTVEQFKIAYDKAERDDALRIDARKLAQRCLGMALDLRHRYEEMMHENPAYSADVSAWQRQIERLQERLEKLGYKVKTGLGNKNSRISLAVYDEATDRYLVGIELDTDAFETNAPLLERDVYRPRFIQSRGWTLMRVFSRDWWISPAKVIKSITVVAERNRKAK